jgi:DNA-binding MarR family transcriptional regulator
VDPAEQAVPLPRLLALAFSDLIDGLHERLMKRGWRDVRPRYGYVLLAVAGRPRTGADIAGLMDMTKQAASKLIDEMEAADYVRRRPHRDDARAKLVTITPRGKRLLATVELIYRELEGEWATTIGAAQVEAMRANLTAVVAERHGGQLPDVRPGS